MKANFSRKSLKITGYAVVFLLFLLFFVYSGFPVESLKMRIISEIKNNSPYDIDIGSMQFPESAHVSFREVTVKRGKDIVNFETILIRPGLTDLIKDHISVPFTASGLGGDISGTISLSRNERSVKDLKVRLSGIDASLLSQMFDMDRSKLELKGDIDGNINVDFAKNGNRYTAQGSYNFTSEDFTISNIKIESFSLPGYKDLKTDLKGTFDTQKTKIDKLNFRNEDFELSFFGTMPPVWELSKGGKLDLFLNLNLYSNEAKLGFLKAFLSPQSDGTLAAKILGTVSNPRLVKDAKYEF